MTLWLDWSVFVHDIIRVCLIIGGGFVTYLFQKHMEKKSNKYDMAKIIKNEVKRIMKLKDLNKIEFKNDEKLQNYRDQTYPLTPNIKIYHGILHTTNIKYFDILLWDKLHIFYEKFESNARNPDIVLGISIVKDLEKMIEDNKSYRQSIYSRSK